MITLKLHITRLEGLDFVIEKQSNFSHAVHRLYNRLDEAADPQFIRRTMERFNLNDIEYRSVKAAATAAREQDLTRDEQLRQKIQSLSDDLNDNVVPFHKRFKVMNRIARYERRIGKPQVFGGVETLRELTRECNKAERDESKVRRLRDEFHEKRLQSFFIVGEGNQKGNRFFDLSHLADGVCHYKPCKGKRFEIRFEVEKRRKHILERLSEYATQHELPVSVRLSTDSLWLIFDEEALNGYAFNAKACKAECKPIKEKHLPADMEKEDINRVYKEWHREQENRMLVGKNPNRAVAVDLNPTNIGWSVIERDGDGVRIIMCGQFDFSNLCRKTGLPSTHKKSRRLAAKRKYELSIALKKLFAIANHYGCAIFAMEELGFRKDGSLASKEANRKNRNLWCRTLCEQIITRRCHECGIELRRVNPCYTSFIGNVQHKYVDATNASIEIGRRALLKFEKGSFYPEVRQEDIRTVEARFGPDAVCGNAVGWVALYKSLVNVYGIVEFNHRARVALDEASPHRTLRMSSYKSGVFYNTFY